MLIEPGQQRRSWPIMVYFNYVQHVLRKPYFFSQNLRLKERQEIYPLNFRTQILPRTGLALLGTDALLTYRTKCRFLKKGPSLLSARLSSSCRSFKSAWKFNTQ